MALCFGFIFLLFNCQFRINGLTGCTEFFKADAQERKLFVCLLKNIIKQLTSFGEGGEQQFCTAPCPRFAAWPEPPAHTQLPEQAPAPLQLHFLPPIC